MRHRRNFRKKGSKRFKPHTKVDRSLSKRIKKIENEIEVKHSDFISGAGAYSTIVNEATTSLVCTCLNALVQGSDSDDRVGSEIIAKKLQITLSLRGQPLAVGDSRVRVVIFWYKNSNALAPVGGQLFDLSLIAASTYAYPNIYYKDSFKILYDKVILLKTLDWNGTTTCIPDIQIKKLSFRLSRRVKYVIGAGAGTFADILSNSLWIGFCTSSAYGAADVNNPQYLFTSRFRYVDA